MSRVLTCLVAACVMAAAFAQRAPTAPNPEQQYRAFVGQAELIVLATIQETKMPEVPKTGMAGITTAPSTLKIDKVLKGTFADAAMTLHIPLRPEYGPYVRSVGMTIKSWQPELEAGNQIVLGLGMSAKGYTAAGRYLPVFTGDKADAIAAVIAKFPVQATLAVPKGGVVIDTDTAWTITVKNTGATALDITSAYVSGFYRHDALEGSISYYAPQTSNALPATGAPVQPKVLATVKAGEEATITITTPTPGPGNWKLFDAKVFPLKGSVLATVALREQTADGKPGLYLTTISNRQDIEVTRK